ncbi:MULTISPECIES: hypothetical protein [Chryseobacterium]|uniref:hypothetical protein n=1 Tax=Chryseobacterium TaxID=59732 RepID=UPI001BE934CE|nr:MULTISPECIES: hypothetical protein [Chryseobacterium]MBT2619916.1 hypothetical protein [Chryseobacterium sp. ISL-6]
MNLLNRLQQYTTHIMDEPHLSGIQQEEKMIQVFDLCHFIDIYNQSLQIIDYEHKINVIEENGIRKGIYFCDLLYNIQYSIDKWMYQISNLQNLKNQLKIEELWFVIVVESFFSKDLIGSEKFVKKNNVDRIYNKIFYFNFSQSTIKILK